VARDGRLLELIIQAIERLLAGVAVEIQSPEFIRDRDTESLREIDVAIRGKVGSSEVLGIVECRDRQGKQDVRWIEEIESKRISVQANFAVAVSRSGFTNGAIKKASALGMNLRTLEDLAVEDFSDWFDCQDYRFVLERFDNLRISLLPAEGTQPDELPDFSNLKEGDPILRISETGAEVCNTELAQNVRSTFAGRLNIEELRKSPGYKEHLELGETWESQPFAIAVALPPEVPIEFLSGIAIAAIEVRCDHVVTVKRMPHSVMKRICSVPAGGEDESLGVVGMYSQPIDDSRVLRIWTQSDGGGKQQMYIQVDSPSKGQESTETESS
jgi:hypothetical protein